LINAAVYATEQNPKALGSTVPELDLPSLPAALNPLSSAIPKTKFSMHTPEVAKSLHERAIQSVVIVGIEAHVCVLQTCLDLLAHNVQVHIVADGVSSCNAQEIPIALEVGCVLVWELG
jgi:nicotinamidase-related amidase